MKSSEPLRIVIAETSVIVRSGIASLLRHLPGWNIHPVEVGTMEMLNECFRMQRADLLVVNPSFGGWFDLVAFKEAYPAAHTKYMALLCSVVDASLLEDYDERISIYETAESLSGKLNALQHVPLEVEQPVEPEALSQREREIIVCVVKGMTNKAIAEKLFLSIHTVITHRRNIARKLQIHSPAGLAIYAIVNKLVKLQDIEGRL